MARLREKVDVLLNWLSIQTAIIVIVLVDLLLVTSLLLIDLQIIQSPPSDADAYVNSGAGNTKEPNNTGNGNHDPVQTAEDVLHIIQIIILSLFFTEIILRVLSRGIDLLEDKCQIFDGLVVIVTFALYVSLTGAINGRTVTYSMGYIIVLRLWRIVRIYNSLTHPVIRKAERIIIAHRKAWKQAEEHLKYANNKLEQKQKEIDGLKVQVKHLQLQHVKSSHITAKLSSHSPHTRHFSSSEDGLTSEDDFENESTNVVLESVTVECCECQNKPTPNGSVPNGTPKGSMGSLPNGSLPGTPKSTSSHVISENLDSVVSDGSSAKFPDIVEDTQEAEARIHRDSSLDREVETADGSKEDPDTKDHSVHIRTSAVTTSGEPQVAAEQLNTVKGRSGTSPLIGQHKQLEPVPIDHRLRPVQEGQIQVDFRGEDSRASGKEGDAASHIGTETSQLVPAGKARPPKLAYMNPGFSLESLTEEELKEIQRISQVPFGSTTVLTKEGVPMTDL